MLQALRHHRQGSHVIQLEACRDTSKPEHPRKDGILTNLQAGTFTLHTFHAAAVHRDIRSAPTGRTGTTDQHATCVVRIRTVATLELFQKRLSASLGLLLNPPLAGLRQGPATTRSVSQTLAVKCRLTGTSPSPACDRGRCCGAACALRRTPCSPVSQTRTLPTTDEHLRSEFVAGGVHDTLREKVSRASAPGMKAVLLAVWPLRAPAHWTHAQTLSCCSHAA